jgi:hypothetical protein
MQRNMSGVPPTIVPTKIDTADQASKSLVLAARPGAGGGLVSVKLVRNAGASFGVGAGAAGAGAVAVMLGTGTHLRRWLSTRRDAS